MLPAHTLDLPDPVSQAPRSLVLLNELGDVEVEWTPENDGVMRGIIQKKMDEGVRFFQVTVRDDQALREPIRNVEDLVRMRINVADEDIERAFLSGQVYFRRRRGSADMAVTRVDDAAIAARTTTVGVRQFSGG
jgi:hypothetical protein